MIRHALVAALAALVVGCAGSSKNAPPPMAAEAPAERHEPPTPAAMAPPPPPPAGAAQTATESKATASVDASTHDTGPASSRSISAAQASGELERSQRELDVAGGDCTNACRALGSMDRAAGRLCSLVPSNDERDRCGVARAHVYRARDKVKSTCGRCPDVSVDRGDPIPSR